MKKIELILFTLTVTFIISLYLGMFAAIGNLPRAQGDDVFVQFFPSPDHPELQYQEWYCKEGDVVALHPPNQFYYSGVIVLGKTFKRDDGAVTIQHIHH